jgi:hypothetical protein
MFMGCALCNVHGHGVVCVVSVLGSAWFVHGMCRVCAWYVQQCMVCACSVHVCFLHGLCMVCLWFEELHGGCMDCAWSVHGMCKNAWSVLGQRMVCSWFVYGS